MRLLIPYRNATFQLIRHITEEPGQTYQKVTLYRSRSDQGISDYLIDQLARTWLPDSLLWIDEILHGLNYHNLLLLEYAAQFRQIGTNLYKREMYLSTCLADSSFGRRFHTDPRRVPQTRLDADRVLFPDRRLKDLDTGCPDLVALALNRYEVADLRQNPEGDLRWPAIL